MRLTPVEITAIKTAVHRLDAGAAIYLFGSRTDDAKRGGDIDLLIISPTLTRHDERTIRLLLEEQLGEQKIDLIIAADDQSPFVRLALAQGIKL